MKKITFFLFSLFCVVSLTVNAQDDGGDVAVNTCGTSYLCDGTVEQGNANWGADCPDGSDEILSYCCDNNFPAYVEFGLCGDDGDSSDSTVVVDPEPACEDGLTELIMVDSYGDGWNGAELIINGDTYFLGDGAEASTCLGLLDCNTIEWIPGAWDGETSWTLGTLSGIGGSGAGSFGEGCDDGSGDDGSGDDGSGDDGSDSTVVSACDDGLLELIMVDSYGDGWNGAVLTINGNDYTLEGLEESLCIDIDTSACVFMSWTPGAWDGETSWTLGGDFASGAQGSAVESIGCLSGCLDENATNYNPAADISDDSCEYSVTPGCMDVTACNYSLDAQIDDGSCEFPAANYDCDGNCLATVVSADGGLYQTETFWTLTDCAGDVILEGGAPFAGCADISAGYSVSMGDTYGDGWNGDLLTVGIDTFELSDGAEAYDLATCAVPGCTDEGAENYNADANSDDGSCEYLLVQGCTDEVACNYDSAAESDNGSCEYPLENRDCDGNCLDGHALLFMNDSYGDGWNGAAIGINGVDYSVPNPGATSTACVNVTGCILFTWTSGSFDSETAWVLGGDLDVPLAIAENGTVPAPIGCEGCEYPVALSGSADSNTGVNEWFSFVMDAAGSASVNVLAVTDFPEFIETTVYSDCDGSVASADDLEAGTYLVNVVQTVAEVGDAAFTISVDVTILGCTDSGAANYDPSANTDDDSCEYIYGCTDMIAENYNADASTDDGSCEYISGCTDDQAINFNPAATLDDESCQYVTCLQTSALLTLNSGSYGSEVSFSITDLNNQVLAEIEGGTLLSNSTYEIDLCLSDANSYTAILADSYGDGWNGGNFVISTCDGSLIAALGTIATGYADTVAFTVQDCDTYSFGCTDSLAANYDQSADQEDGSCLYPGCTDSAYLEYDEGANDDDGSCLTMVVSGCTDDSAPNYDEAANVDDGSCQLAIACADSLGDVTGFEISMADSYGDGWNGNVYSIVNSSGEEVATGGLPSEGFSTTPEGTSGSDVHCVAPGCYMISVAGGTYITETSWSISTVYNGTSLVNGGGDNSVTTFALDSDEDCSNLTGCMDMSADNYSDMAVVDDGSCTYPTSETCEDAIAMDSIANGYFGDQVWFSVSFDTEQFVTASVEGGSSFYLETSIYASCEDTALAFGVLEAGTYYISVVNTYAFYNGDPFVLTVNSSDVIAGCMDIYADNYNAEANIDGEECLYPCDGTVATMTVNASNYGGEMYWELIDSVGLIIAYADAYSTGDVVEIPLCLDLNHNYTMNTYDSYGDGWNGSTYSISANCGEDSTAFSYIVANNGGASPANDSTVVSGDYYFESTEVFALVSCDEVTPGCMDETAFNYNPDANVTDGNCIPVTPGCMDETALNYDSDANTDSPDDCVYGCDGEYVTVTVTTGLYAGEVSWQLINDLGGQLLSNELDGALSNNTSYEHDICLPIGVELTFSAVDSYGDGWNGGSFAITSCPNIIEGGVNQASGMPAGTGADYPFIVTLCDDIVPGCIDENALNYNSDATHDDASCDYNVPSMLEPVNGAVVELSSIDSLNPLVFTWEPLYPTSLVGLGYYYIYFSTDSNDLEGSMTIFATNNSDEMGELEWMDEGALQDLYLDSGYGAGDEFTLYWWVSPDNYLYSDNESSYFNGANALTLTISQVFGCTDTTALNFDEMATDDDDSCEYPCESGFTLTMNDSYGDSWNGNELIINGFAYTLNGINDDGSSATVCVDVDLESCIMFGWTTGSFEYETSFTLMNPSSEIVFEGGAGLIPDMMGECLEGCMDSNYEEFNPDAQVDTDPTSCVTFLGTCTPVSMVMDDSYGDGWNGATYSIVDAAGNEVANGGLSTGLTATDEVCLDDGCYTITVGGGTYDYEISWTLGDLASGVAPESVNFSLNGDCEFAVLGCTDPGADNYNPDATEDDGSCFTTISGCTDPAADNYDDLATTDDGSCYYSCAEGTAQIDILITTDTYSGSENSFTLEGDNGFFVNTDFESEDQITTVTSTYCVDNGTNMTFVLSDSWGDGIVNGGYQIFVCQEDVTGFVPMTGISEVSDEFMASCGDIIGCMDESALNYNADATSDNGSCLYPCGGLDALVNISIADYGSEVSWDLIGDGVVVASGSGYSNNSESSTEVCLEDGISYTMVMIDSYGDGWNGGSFSIDAACGQLASGALESGSEGLVDFTATCGGGEPGCDAPADWVVTVTGSNHTIMIPAGVLPQMAEGTVLDHANVGVFFTNDNGDLVCAGSAEITGETVQIAAMGDDTTTDEIDGLQAGEPLLWMIADCNGNVFSATATYLPNGPDVFTTNGLTFVASISELPAGPSSQLLNMPSGWSMFSTYMIADDMDMASVLSPIIDQVIIAKNNSGAAYLVEWNFNGVGDLLVGQGYQIKTTEAVELEVSGAYAFPEDNPVDISAGWNMVGYLRTEPAAADAVMADINATGNLVIAKDYNGAAYLPEWNFNGIGDMVPGQGYQLKTVNEDALQYLSNDDSYRMSATEVTENNVSHYSKVAATDNNMTVVIEDAAWDVLPAEGAEIAAFDKDGNMVGSAIYSSPVTVVTVWGDDVTSTSKDGMLVSESVSFKVWNTNEVLDFTVSKWIEGSSSYLVDGISVASTIETNNVITELNASERVLVKVINVLGQEVNMDDEPFKGTVLFNVYDDGSVEQFVR